MLHVIAIYTPDRIIFLKRRWGVGSGGCHFRSKNYLQCIFGVILAVLLGSFGKKRRIIFLCHSLLSGHYHCNVLMLATVRNVNNFTTSLRLCSLNVFVIVRSRFLITLIKCLKGHKCHVLTCIQAMSGQLKTFLVLVFFI